VIRLPDAGRLLFVPWLGQRVAARVLAGSFSAVPATIRHRYDFGADTSAIGDALNSPAAWDALRSTTGVFGVPTTRDGWESAARTPQLATRARAVAAIARALGARRVGSYGVGGASFERALALEAPGLELVCTEYAPQTIARLQELFPSAEVVAHDLRHDPPLDVDLHIFHRIDTELSNAEWRRVLPSYDPVLFVAAGVLDWPTFVVERTGRGTSAGWLRNASALHALWSPTHDSEPLKAGDLRSYLLRRRRA
jgi:hypothetical protein